MEVVSTAAELSALTSAARRSWRTVGFVPTMGALHAGHASLVGQAAGDGHLVVVSIFVNPRQFGADEDLDRYPRSLGADLEVAEAEGASALFVPAVSEIYPDGFATTVAVAGLTERLEGAVRPGHFDGVTTVLTKLFSIVGPSSAYFGEKDFQQLQVVRRLVSDLGLPVEVLSGPTVRDGDGLALSSRNAALSPDQRLVASVLHRALLAGASVVGTPAADPAAVRGAMVSMVERQPAMTLDYAEVVDADTLVAAPDLARSLRLMIAGLVGTTRLIDNLAV